MTDQRDSEGRRPRGRPRDRSVEERVVHAALQLVTELGLERWSVDDLARRAGVSRSTIFRRWGSRDNVVSAAFDRLVSATVELPDTGVLRDDLEALVGAELALCGSEPGRTAMAFAVESLDWTGGARERPHAGVRHVTLEYRRAYEAVLARAQERGELSAGVDREVAVDLVSGAMWGRLLGFEPLGYPQALARRIVDLVLQGLTARS